MPWPRPSAAALAVTPAFTSTSDGAPLTPTRWILTIASFLAAIGVSVYVVSSTWPAEGAPLGLPWWAHAIVLASVGLEIFFRVAKIVFSARALDIPIGFGASARTIMGGDFAGAITPSRSGTEPARFLVLSEAGIPAASILIVLFVELFLEVVSLAIVAAVLAVVAHDSGSMLRGVFVSVLLYGGGALALLTLALAVTKRNAAGPPPTWLRALGVNAGMWRRVQRSLRQLRGSAASLRSARRGALIAALVCSILHIVARLLPLPIIVLSYEPGVAVGPMMIWPLLLLYGASIAPAPGGGGVVELAFKAALGGTLPARLLATSLIWWRFYTFYIYIGIGALAAGGTVMRALRRVKPDDADAREGIGGGVIGEAPAAPLE